MPSENTKTILLADDDPILLEMYQERLGVDGFKVITVHDGKAALEKAGKEKIDLILLDIMMPKMNGLDVLRELKSSEKTKKIPVFLLTALVQEAEKMKGVTAGAEDYIVKSEIMPGEVVNKIKKILNI